MWLRCKLGSEALVLSMHACHASLPNKRKTRNVHQASSALCMFHSAAFDSLVSPRPELGEPTFGLLGSGVHGRDGVCGR